MELRHMRYFVAVAEELNFTKAAYRLCIVQPSLSKQIKDLEDEVGVMLFERDKRKVSLTKAGKEFLKYAYETLESATKAISIAKQVVCAAEQNLKIAMNSAAEQFFLPHICTRLEKKNIALEITSNTCLNNMHELRNFKTDLSFSRFSIKETDYVSKLIKEEKLFLVMNRSSNKAAINQMPYISFTAFEDPILNDQAKSFIERSDIQISKHIPSSNIFQFLNIFKSLTCWSIVPEHMLAHLDCFHEYIELKVPLYMNYRKKNKSELIKLLEGCIS